MLAYSVGGALEGPAQGETAPATAGPGDSGNEATDAATATAGAASAFHHHGPVVKDVHWRTGVCLADRWIALALG